MSKAARIGAALAAGVLSLSFLATPAQAAEPSDCFLGVCWGDQTSSPKYEPEPIDACGYWVKCKRDRTVCDGGGLWSPCDESDKAWRPHVYRNPGNAAKSADDCTLAEIWNGSCPW